MANNLGYPREKGLNSILFQTKTCCSLAGEGLINQSLRIAKGAENYAFSVEGYQFPDMSLLRLNFKGICKCTVGDSVSGWVKKQKTDH